MSTRDSFNAEALLTTFKECMRTLEHFGDRNEHRIKKLEELCKTQEKEQNGRVRNLEQLYQVCVCVCVCIHNCLVEFYPIFTTKLTHMFNCSIFNIRKLFKTFRVLRTRSLWWLQRWSTSGINWRVLT